MNADADMTHKRLQLWFFRDLSEEQRTKLFVLVFYPAFMQGESMTMNDQAKLLDRMVEQLRGTT